MKKFLLILALVLLPLAAAASYSDTLDADFSAGNVSATNATNDSILLRNATLTAYNTSGVFTSRIFDLGQNPINTTINWSYTTPTGTSVLIATRSGASLLSFASWSTWSSSYSTSTGSTITSPRNRYYQYQASLSTSDNTSTPELYDVTLSYVENGTEAWLASSSANITSGSSGSQSIVFFINDTFTPVAAVAAYRYDNATSTGTYGNAVNLTQLTSTTWNLTVASVNWYSYRYGNVTMQVNVTVNNGSANNTTSFTIREPIEFVNTAPVMDPVSDQTLQQNVSLNITVTASDYDNQSLTFTTNASYVTVTSLTSTSARLTWTPNATQIGLHSIIVYANDSYANGSDTFTVNVTDVNDAPVISSVSAISGYHGIRLPITLTAYDPDSGANITFSMIPSFFTFTTSTTTGNSSASAGTYYGIFNSTPADDEHGVHNVTFIADDGYNTSNTTATLTVEWCGDLTCQSTYETATSCPIDCDVTPVLDQIALIVPDRNCANKSMTLYAFNASNRFSCYYEGLVEQGFALCEGLDGVNVKVYVRNGTKLTESTTLTSGTNGTMTYTPAVQGEYKFSAEKEDYANVSKIVYVRDCSEQIIEQTQNITIEQPPVTHTNRTRDPEVEKPAPFTKEEASWFSILIFYMIVPLLLAALLYASVVFYDVNKDTLPWLLEVRIILYEQRVKYDPQIKKAQRIVEPVWEPIAESVKALYGSTLKPLIDKLKNKKQ